MRGKISASMMAAPTLRSSGSIAREMAMISGSLAIDSGTKSSSEASRRSIIFHPAVAQELVDAARRLIAIKRRKRRAGHHYALGAGHHQARDQLRRVDVAADLRL